MAAQIKTVEALLSIAGISNGLFFRWPIVTTVHPMGGRLNHFVKAWSLISPGPWTFSTVSEGVVVDFVKSSFSHVFLRKLPLQEKWN